MKMECVMLGCTLNSWTVNLLHQQKYNNGTLLSLAQFGFVSLLTGILALGNQTYRHQLKAHFKPIAKMSFLYWLSNFLTKVSYRYGAGVIAISLMASSNIIITELLTVYMGRKRWNLKQFMACCLIGFGILWLLIHTSSSNQNFELIGFGLLLTASICGVVLAQGQKTLTDSVHWIPLTFGFNVVPLPLSLLFADFKYDGIPHIAFGANILSHFMCICGVNILFTQTTPIGVVLITTLRKFLSILITDLWYSTLPRIHVGISTLCVLGGHLIYSVYKAS